jgi:hypothetical protein
VDIPKILNSLDSDLADKFKKRNGMAYQHLMEKGQVEHHHDEGDLCDEMHSKIFIPQEDRNNVEKLIAEEIYPPRFKLNLKEILKETHDAYITILEKIKQKSEKGEGPETLLPNFLGMQKPKALTFDDEECKQIMKKLTYESVNRFIRNKVRKQIIEKEKSYANQQMLLAFPSGAPEGSSLDQISSESIGQLMEVGF